MHPALPYVLASAFLLPGFLALLIRDPRRSRVVGFGGGAVASFLDGLSAFFLALIFFIGFLDKLPRTA